MEPHFRTKQSRTIAAELRLALLVIEMIECAIGDSVLTTLFYFFKVAFVEAGKGRLADVDAEAVGRRSSDQLAGLGVRRGRKCANATREDRPGYQLPGPRRGTQMSG